jgi:carboxypeptidase family protein
MKRNRFLPALLLACMEAFAQAPTAVVAGSIQDPSGEGVPGARVRQVDTNVVRQAASDVKGEFTVADLAPGPYEIAVEKEGFHSLIETGLQLEVSQTARLILGCKSAPSRNRSRSKPACLDQHRERRQRRRHCHRRDRADAAESRNFTDLAFLVPGSRRLPESRLRHRLEFCGKPIAFVDQVTGGAITSAGAPRVMQLALRYDF